MTSPAVSRSAGLGAIFSNMKVKTKILAGFAVIIAILAVAGAASTASLLTISGKIDMLSDYEDVVSTAGELEVNVLRLRRYVREYALTGDDGDAAKAEEVVAKLREQIARALQTIENPALDTKINEMAGLMETYVAGFERTVDMRHEEDSLVSETLNPTGRALREEFQQMAKDATEAGNSNAAILAREGLQWLMQVRLNVNKVLSGYDEALLEEIEHEFAELQKIMTALDGASQGSAFREEFETIQSHIVIYYETFEKVEKVDQERLALIDGAMRDAALAMNDAVDFVAATAKDDATALEHETIGLVHQVVILVIALSAGGLALGLAFAFLIGGAIAKRLVRMTSAMRELADGSKAIEVPSLGDKDEIGGMAQALQVFKQNAVEMDRLAQEQRREQERKEERHKVVDGYVKGFEQKIAGILGTVASAATELNQTAEGMSATAEETTRQSTAVAAASEQATSNVQTVASAAEELSASVQEISRQVAQSTEITSQAVSEVGRTNVTVKGLAEAAQKIGEVVQLINDIASQTNLLALNATIEAARAGEAGKGFAVVASEVKNLANQTAKATEDIGAQIGAIQEATGGAVQAIEGIGGTISRVSEIATTIASAVEEQGAATQEIARNVAQAAQGTQEVSSNIAGVSQAASETGAASAEVLATAAELAKQSDVLKNEVADFLAKVRAA